MKVTDMTVREQVRATVWLMGNGTPDEVALLERVAAITPVDDIPYEEWLRVALLLETVPDVEVRPA